jgi:hypothetical protein
MVARLDVEDGARLLELDEESPELDDGVPELVDPLEPEVSEEAEPFEVELVLVPEVLVLVEVPEVREAAADSDEWPGISIATATASPTDKAEAPRATLRVMVRTRLWAMSRSRALSCPRALSVSVRSASPRGYGRPSDLFGSVGRSNADLLRSGDVVLVHPTTASSERSVTRL